MALLTQPDQLPTLLNALKEPPRIVITDSQAFEQVARDVPEDVPLTSFSILLARQRGFLNAALEALSLIHI